MQGVLDLKRRHHQDPMHQADIDALLVLRDRLVRHDLGGLPMRQSCRKSLTVRSAHSVSSPAQGLRPRRVFTAFCCLNFHGAERVNLMCVKATPFVPMSSLVSKSGSRNLVRYVTLKAGPPKINLLNILMTRGIR